MAGVYKKIEKRIVKLKEKEEIWKARYREIAQQVKELVDSNSEQMKEMENAIRNFEEKSGRLETETRKTSERSEEMFRLMDKRITDLSGFSKGLSERLEEKDDQIKKLKSDIVSQVSGMIARHEKSFDSVLEKIGLAARRIENGFQKEEGLYEKMESAKRFMESYNISPPNPAPPEPSFQRRFPSTPQPPAPAPAPVNERFESETPFIYELGSPAGPPQNFARRASRRPVDFDDLDDDTDVDDLVSGNMRGFKESVKSMNSNVSSITEKLASIEERMAKMQAAKNPGLERLDDKIRMYSQSVAGIHSRMETVEKALRDGMTPMMESLKLLTDSVKSLKEESRPSIQKPQPPRPKAREEGVLAPTPSNRTPPTFERVPWKQAGTAERSRQRKKGSDAGFQPATTLD